MVKRKRRRQNRPPKPAKKSKNAALRPRPSKLEKAGTQKKAVPQVSISLDRVAKKGRPALPKKDKDIGEEVTLDKTPMRIYLQQIEQIPLLTPEEEVEVSRKIVSGNPGAKEAREKMIRSNLRLVISIAKRYANLGLPFSDLVEEGNIGLMRAVDKFNYRKGYRFSTYASWWIKQAIMRALSNQGKTIRVPVYMYDVISKWRKVRDSLIQKLSRIPTENEIADVMKIPVEKVKEVERIGSQPGSLNAPVSLDGSAEMMDLIEDDSITSPVDNVEGLFEGARIDQLLSLVDERERQVLILRFGLKGGEPRTLEETAKHFGVTRERIRQIEFAAIRKIRYLLKLKEERLEDYVR